MCHEIRKDENSELDKAYGDRALMAGIRFGVDEFCKRFDVDEKYKKRIEKIKRR